MSSNILFTDVQNGAAASLGIEAGPLLAAQTSELPPEASYLPAR